jgi:hypothetical protein
MYLHVGVTVPRATKRKRKMRRKEEEYEDTEEVV